MSAIIAPPPRVIWTPHPGSQRLFLSCPFFEALYEGTRGPGKTDALLMSYAQYVGRGYGEAWRGIIFRREYKELADLVSKSKKWFRQIFPNARWLSSLSDYKWVWPTGEELLFRTFKSLDDYWNYHGHEYPFIGWEELTAWATLRFYHVMKSCCRSTVPGMPRMIRGTTNPYGPGHNTVKAYWIDPAPAGVPFIPPQVELPEEFADIDVGEPLMAVRIHGHYRENKALMAAQPNYAAMIAQSADSEARARAWLDGSWDIVAGGMFDDVWGPGVVVEPFAIPRNWYVDRSFDWGSSKPFAAYVCAESNGEEVQLADGTWRTFPRGSVFLVGEEYGWNGKPNEGLRLTDAEIAKRILEMEAGLRLAAPVRVGPADSAIYAVTDGESTAQRLERAGLHYEPAAKGPGSRVSGWQKMREMLKAAKEGDREKPGLYVFSRCRQFLRTVPTLPRDEKKPDDVDTDAEDHAADAVRYRISAEKIIERQA